MIWLGLCTILVTIFTVKWLVPLVGFIWVWLAARQLPCPPGARWLAGHQNQLPFAPGFRWLRDTVAAYPRVYTLWLGITPFPVLVHPDTIRPLVSSTTGTIKSVMYRTFDGWFTNALGLLEGAQWMRHRRLLTGSFHFSVLKTYVPTYNDCVEVLLQKMEQFATEGRPMDVDREVDQCTFDAILRTACSHESNCQLKSSTDDEMDLSSATKTLSRIAMERSVSPLLLVPWIFRLSSLYPKWTKALRYVRTMTDRLINDRKTELEQLAKSGNQLNNPRDFLDTVLLARDADGSGLTVDEITDEVNVFLFGGHDTTSSTLTWLLYELAKHPEHQAKIQEEVDALLGNRESDRITSNDLAHLHYTTLVIKETLRMYTPVGLPSRELTEPFNVDGITLPIGTTVHINLYQLHHNPDVWGEDHMEFKPSRFLPEKTTKMDPFAYLPFSAGQRNCIGQQFALNELKVMVARIAKRFQVSLVPGEPSPVPNLQVVVKPLNDLLLNVELRHKEQE